MSACVCEVCDRRNSKIPKKKYRIPEVPLHKIDFDIINMSLTVYWNILQWLQTYKRKVII